MFKKYKDYMINTEGVIIGTSGKTIAGTKNSKGYLQTTGKNNKKYLIHRLIAECWINCPGEFIEYEVNHKDGNKLNNNIDNLEWLTPEEHREADKKRRIDNIDDKSILIDHFL